MMAVKRGTDKLIVSRLVPDIDARLRRHTNTKGKLAPLVLDILSKVDLESVGLIDKVSGRVLCTSVWVPKGLHEKISRAAETRGVSMNRIVNSAIESILAS
jgi:hypothetical protein